LDDGLSFFARRGRIAIGSKLAVSGAVMDPDGADPLKMLARRTRGLLPPGGGPCLRLTINGTRAALWNAKLGFQKRCATRSSGDDDGPGGIRGGSESAMVLPLCSLTPGGGTVPAVDVVVHRRYPRLFRECGFGSGGGSGRGTMRILTEGEEEALQMEHQGVCQRAAEEAAAE
ncbi:unnamed protein product, partial [Phaeothamnion confervicola]